MAADWYVYKLELYFYQQGNGLLKKCICADAVAQLKVTTDATNLNIRSTPSTEGEFLVNLHIMKQ